MKTIGIIGAMDEETARLKSLINVISQKKIIDVDFTVGNLHGKNVVLVRSGIGKVNAAICTQVLIDLYGVDCVINTGVAGGIYPHLKIGSLVISSDTVQHDFDTSPMGDPVGVIPRAEESFFKADTELVKLAQEVCGELIGPDNVFVGRVASGDQFISDPDKVKRISDLFDAYCVEMEGAAIAQTCYLNHVPFVIIRAISDKSDEVAHLSYEQFVEMSAQVSSQAVEGIIKAL